MGTKCHPCLNKPISICLSMYGLLYPSGIKGVIYTKSNLSLINMSISTHVQLLSVLVYIHYYYKQCHSAQRLSHFPCLVKHTNARWMFKPFDLHR